MQVYLVGGAVRDQLLNRPVTEHDYVVVGSSVEEMLSLGFQQVGADFPVFLHPKTQEEYALARTERKSGKGYLGFSVQSDPSVTLAEDLMRRDLTINAMAIEVNGLFDPRIKDATIIDPYGGLADIEKRLLRHVSAAFSEDPVRVLRLARFTSRYAPLGFSIAPETKVLVTQMVAANELDHLVAERVWAETHAALIQPWGDIYFSCLYELGALAVVMPPLATIIKKAHTNQQWPKSARALRQAHQFNLDDISCFALLMTVFLPYEQEQQELAHTLWQHIKIPKAYQQFSEMFLTAFAELAKLEQLNAQALFEVFKITNALKDVTKLHQAINCMQSYTIAQTHDALDNLITQIKPISAQDVAADLTGRAIGNAIEKRRLDLLTDLMT